MAADDYLRAAGMLSTSEPPPGPAIDADTLARMTEAHQRQMASYDPEDPRSPVYRRPALAEEYRARTQTDFDALLLRAGTTAPKPPTPAEAAEARFEASWSAPPISDAFAEQMDRALEAEEADPGMAARHRMELFSEYGEDGYKELIRQAKVAIEDGQWIKAIETQPSVLKFLAARGRFLEGYQRARGGRR